MEACSLDAVLVFATVHNRLQSYATVLERRLWQKVAVPMGSSARGVIFGGFQRCVIAFRTAGVALIVALRRGW